MKNVFPPESAQKIYDTLALLREKGKKGMPKYTLEQISKISGFSTTWIKAYAFCYPGITPVEIIQKHETWRLNAPERWEYNPENILKRAQAAVGQTLTRIEFGEIEWDWRDRNHAALVQAALTEIILHFEDAYPISFHPLHGMKNMHIGVFQAPDRFVQKDPSEFEMHSFYTSLPGFLPLIGQKITQITYHLYGYEGTEYFPDEKLWWQPIGNRFTEDCPADAAELQIEFEQGQSIFLMVGRLGGTGLIRNVDHSSENNLIICWDQEIAHGLRFGLPDLGMVRLILPT